MCTGRRRVRVAGPTRPRGVAALLAVTLAAGVSVLLPGGDLASAAAGGRAAVPSMHWGRAEEVPGTAALNAGGNAAVTAVSCWRAGNCVAGGFYTDASGHQQAFVVTESSDVWGEAEEVPGTAGLNAGGGARVRAVSCAPGEYCAAVGYYTDSKGNLQAFVVSRARGRRWGAAQEVPGTGKLNAGGHAVASSVSCPSAGNCAAGGSYQSYYNPADGVGASQAFVVSERNGRWAPAERVPGSAVPNSQQWSPNGVRSISCASAGNCTAAGTWWNGNRFTVLGFVSSEVNGRWHRLVQPKGGGPVSSVSCWHAGDCTAGGTTNPFGGARIDGFVETQAGGRWGVARERAALSGDIVTSVSCPSAGNCAAGGNLGLCGCDYQDTNGAFVLSERNGRWGKVDDLDYDQTGPANGGTVISLSCPSAGNCGAGGSGFAGDDQNGNELIQAFVVSERDGRWTPAETPPGEAALDLGVHANSQVNSVSCPSATSCAAGGYYADAAGNTQAFING